MVCVPPEPQISAHNDHMWRPSVSSYGIKVWFRCSDPSSRVERDVVVVVFGPFWKNRCGISRILHQYWVMDKSSVDVPGPPSLLTCRKAFIGIYRIMVRHTNTSHNDACVGVKWNQKLELFTVLVGEQDLSNDSVRRYGSRKLVDNSLEYFLSSIRRYSLFVNRYDKRNGPEMAPQQIAQVIPQG